MDDSFFKYVDSDRVYRGPEVWEHHIDLKKCNLWDVRSLGTLKVLTKDLTSVTIGSKNVLCNWGGLEEVKGSIILEGATNLVSLQKIKRVGGNLDLSGCSGLENLGNLKTIGGYLDIRHCPRLKSLKPIKLIGRTLYLTNFNLLLSIKPGTFKDIFVGDDLPAGVTTDAEYWSRVQEILSSFVAGAEFWLKVQKIKGLPLTDISGLRAKCDRAYWPFIEERLKGEQL